MKKMKQPRYCSPWMWASRAMCSSAVSAVYQMVQATKSRNVKWKNCEEHGTNVTCGGKCGQPVLTRPRPFKAHSMQVHSCVSLTFSFIMLHKSCFLFTFYFMKLDYAFILYWGWHWLVNKLSLWPPKNIKDIFDNFFTCDLIRKMAFYYNVLHKNTVML